MIHSIKRIQSLNGSVVLPASKSYSIRAYIIAACGGQSTIIDPSDCDDALIAKSIAKQLGSTVQKVKGAKNTFRIKSHLHRIQSKSFHVGESGTVLRFLLPILSLWNRPFKVQGSGTLRGRPNAFLTKSLRSMGVSIRGKGVKESVPITITRGSIKGGNVSIDGSLSSQFISALLICAPLLENNLILKLTGPKLVSSDYIIMTEQILKKAGAKIRKKNPRCYEVKGKQNYKGLKNFHVPSDYGLAAFLLAAGALTDSSIHLKGHLDDSYVQADGHIIAFLRRMGVRFIKTKMSIKLKGPYTLKGGVFSLKDCPDLVPIMAVLALFAKGRIRLVDIHHARAKESDRISDLRKELLKVGANVKESSNSLIIIPQEIYRSECLLDSHGDHRLAMAFTVLGLKIGVRVKNLYCCSKSYPGFVRDMKALGSKISKK